MITSNTATSAYGAIWSLAVLGALRQCSEIRFSFGIAVRDHCSRHREDLDRLVATLERVGFPGPIAAMVITDAPWTRSSGGRSLADESELLLEVVMMMRQSREECARLAATADWRGLLEPATTHQLALLLEAVTLAHVETVGTEARPGDHGFGALLSVGSRLAGTKFDDERAEEVVKEWLVGAQDVEQTHPAFVRVVASEVRALDVILYAGCH